MTMDQKEVSPAVPLIRNRDYVIRFAGQIVSTLGTRISSIAFPLLTLSLTQSALQVGIVSALGNLPTIIVGLPAGALIDRWDRKKVAILSDAVRGVNLVSIPVALAFGQLTVWQLYATALLDGLMSVLFFTALQASTRRIVPVEQLAQGAQYDQFAVFSLGVIGPPLGGLLYGIGNAIPFLADAISYSASVVSLLFVRSEFQLERQGAPRDLLKEIREGLVWTWRHGTLRALIAASALFQAVRSGTLLVMIVLAQRANATSFEIGVILALMSIGGILGSVISHRLQRMFTIGHISIGVVWIYTLLYPLLIVVPSPLFFGVIAGLWAIGLPVLQIVQGAYRQLLVPDATQGRVASIVRLSIWSAQSVGAALTGILLQSLGGQGSIVVGFVALVLVGAITTLTTDIRNAPYLAEVSPA